MTRSNRLLSVLAILVLAFVTSSAEAASIFGLASLQPESVPEPGATAGLLGLALLGLAAVRKKLK